EVIAAIPRHIAKKYRVVPVFRHDGTLTVAIEDPSDIATIDSLNHLLRMEINVQVASEADIESALNKYYAERGGVMNPQFKEVVEELTREHVEIQKAAGEGPDVGADAPLIKLVNSLIVDAFKVRASEYHLELYSK